MSIRIYIPARLKSTRLLEKPLYKINDAPLLWHTWKAALECVKCGVADSVTVLTDSQKILDYCVSERIDVINNGEQINGSFRVLDQAVHDCCSLAINWQIDYPTITPDDIKLIRDSFNKTCDDTYYDEPVRNGIYTLYYKHTNPMPISTNTSTDFVKIVTNKDDEALYFSRASIPFQSIKHKIHVGIYAFDMNFSWNKELLYNYFAESKYSQVENLEQLIFLENCIGIKCLKTGFRVGINTPTDVQTYINYCLEKI